MDEAELDQVRERVEESLAAQRQEHGDDKRRWRRATVSDTTVLRLLLYIWDLELRVAELEASDVEVAASARIARALKAQGLTPADLIDVLERPRAPEDGGDDYRRDEHGRLTAAALFQMERGDVSVRGKLARHVLALLDELSKEASGG